MRCSAILGVSRHRTAGLIDKIERHLAGILGDRGRRQLRELLSILLEQEDD
jgi:hypothetical protein